MNLYYFISNRVQKGQKGSFSSLVSVVAVVTISLGLATMIVSFSILEGFKKQIKEKIFSFGAHVQVTKYEIDESFEDSPIRIDADFVKYLNNTDGVEHVQTYLHKPGLLKSDSEIGGVIMKGIGSDFDTSRFRQNMIAGDFITQEDTSYTSQIIISKRLSEKLEASLHDSVWMYFIQQPPRFRKLKIQGIYETGLEEFDEHFIMGDIRLIRNMNDWADTTIGGYEIYLSNFEDLDPMFEKIYIMADSDLGAIKITDKYPDIFDWLELLNKNVMFFIVIILFVACFNMISTIFIMIMERTNMIGVLKAQGASSDQIRSIFLYNGLNILLRGIIWGNVIGIIVCWLQDSFSLVPLDPANYYMYTVPIEWNFPVILLMNLIIVAVVSAAILAPLVAISVIKPVKAIRFN